MLPTRRPPTHPGEMLLKEFAAPGFHVVATALVGLLLGLLLRSQPRQRHTAAQTRLRSGLTCGQSAGQRRVLSLQFSVVA